jgi:hypothetical protein
MAPKKSLRGRRETMKIDRHHFESVARRGSITNDSAQTFLTTTHRDISNPRGMPHAQLLDYQIKQVAAYLMTLRKQP